MSVDLATKSLLHDKLRFLITVSGVAFAVPLVFVQVGLFIGLMDNATLTINQIDADLWITSHNTRICRGPASRRKSMSSMRRA